MQEQSDSVVQVRMYLLTSEFSSSTRGERQSLKVFHNHTMLTTPKRSVHLVVQSQFLNIMVGPQLFNIMVGPQLELSAYMAQSQLPTLFSKSSNSQDHCFQAWRHSHSSPISYLGFIMTIVIVISFAHERKLYPMLCTWTKSRIVQSPTKLNDKI